MTSDDLSGFADLGSETERLGDGKGELGRGEVRQGGIGPR